MTRQARAKKSTGGRPTKYKASYCAAVIECAAEGHSVAAFAGRIGVARSAVYEWAKKNPEFADAMEVAKAKATEFWEKILIKIANGGDGHATAAIFGLKNRASDDWSDRTVQEHTGKDGGPIEVADLSVTELARRIAFILAQAAKE